MLDVLSVSISANGGQGFTPEDVAPVQENFTIKQRETVTRGIQLGIGYTGSPEGQLTLSRGESNGAELSPISIAIRPLYIRAGLTLQEQMWEYQLQRESQTWIELSKQRPPQHQATFQFPSADGAVLPSDLKIRVALISRRAKLFSGWKGVFSTREWQSNWFFSHLNLYWKRKFQKTGILLNFQLKSIMVKGRRLLHFNLRTH